MFCRFLKGEDDQIAIGSLKKLPDISKPRWDQNTYGGRARHFFSTVDPGNVFISNAKLETSRQIVTDYKTGKYDPRLTLGQLWEAKRAFDSAFHPETGEKMFILGRMSSQVPCNMILNGGLLTFRTGLPSVFMHWSNQSFNAVVNYTNRSGDGASNQRLFLSYCCATGGAVGCALYLNSKVVNAAGLLPRLIPFAAVALANAINIPMMRSKELQFGVALRDKDGNEVGKSQYTAVLAISQVVFSRICMAASTMVTVPLLMKPIEKLKFYKGRPGLWAPLIQTLLAGFTLTITTPLCCAFSKQNASIEVSRLEKSVQSQIKSLPNPPTVVYYNKGL